MTPNRRDVLRAGAGFASLALADSLLVSSSTAAQATGPFTLPKLPYATDALEPHIDARTMEIHHGKHHQAYIDNLNKAVAENPQLQGKRAFALLKEIDEVPEAVRQTVINNAGGHVNHSMFWQLMAPGGGGPPTGDVAKSIDKAFGGFDNFKTQLSDAAMKRFGSGWAWLVVDKDQSLKVISTANQDSPIMMGQHPVLGVDVWEHAYYLKYKNKRADYVAAWWNVVNWDYVNELYGQVKRA
jgi:Fe-Mn family superoxide dismutase